MTSEGKTSANVIDREEIKRRLRAYNQLNILVERFGDNPHRSEASELFYRKLKEVRDTR